MHHPVLIILMSGLAIATATANARDTALETEQDAMELVDKTVIEAAMKRSDEGASRLELDRLPLPAFVYFHTLDRALSFRSAWSSQAVASQQNEKAIQTVQFFAFDGAHLNYAEWACETGRETGVAREFVDLISKIVTTYPERLLLKRFAQERSRIGYQVERRCQLDELKNLRRSYEKFRSEMQALNSAGDEKGPS